MEDAMGRPCSTNGVKRNSYKGHWWESLNERDHYEDQDIGGRITVRWILDRREWHGLDWSGSG
jgi:hypothetical protein